MKVKVYSQKRCRLPGCEVVFTPAGSAQKYCCKDHRRQHDKARTGKRPPRNRPVPPPKKPKRAYQDHVCGASLQRMPEARFVSAINNILAGKTLLLRTGGELPEDIGLVARRYEPHSTKPATRRPL